MSLESIRHLVQEDLEATDHYICTELKSDIPFINQLIEYILKAGGKRIRPLLVLLTARSFQHQKRQHIGLAASIELIHTATLLHDDVVDNSDLRRGKKTAKSLWGNEASVLVGDFLYSRAFQVIVRLQHFPILTIFADATNIIAEGEILQLINCHNPDTSEQAYFEVIERKTAKLFEVATRTGSALSTDNQSYLHAMQQYGLNLGIAYQLIDDILDYSGSSHAFGKNIGNDLMEGKPTLPMIYALRKAKTSEVKLLRNAIETGTTKNIADIIDIIESVGAIDYTAEAAKHHALKANTMLKNIPDSIYRQALETLTGFVVERTF